MVTGTEVISYAKANKFLLAADASLVLLGIYSLGVKTFTTVALGVGGWLYLRWKQSDGKCVPLKGIHEKDLKGIKEEQPEWLNEVVRQLWPSISEIVWDIMKDSIEPAIQIKLSDCSFDIFDLLESFHFKEFDLGDQPVRLVDTHVFTDQSYTNKIFLIADLVYDGNAHIEAGLTAASFGIKDIKVSGKIRIELDPVLAKPPLIGGVSVYFLKSPTIDFNLTKALNIGDIPGLNGIIKSAISCVIDKFIVYPNSFNKRFGKEKPSGVLRGKVVSAKGLAAKDHNVFGKDSSDPYVKVKVGEFRYETKVVKNSLSPSWQDESFMVFIEKVREQKIKFKVKDKDDVSSNDLLGRAEVELKKICYAANESNGDSDAIEDADYVLPLKEGHGSLNCQLQWFSFTGDVSLITKQIEMGSVLCVFIKLECATGLPVIEKVDGVHVQITVGGTSTTSLTKRNTTRPVWNETYYFFVHNPRNDTAIFKLKDKDEEDLGHVTVEISKLVAVGDMMISDAFPLEGCATKGVLRASLDLKGLVLGPQEE